MMTKANLYKQVLTVAQDYLGPAAERFMSRQILTHCNKEPNKLAASDMGTLIDWVKLSMAMITSDAELVEDFTRRLTNLSAEDPKV